MRLNPESFNLFNSDFFNSRVGNKEKYLSESTICVSVEIVFLSLFIVAIYNNLVEDISRFS